MAFAGVAVDNVSYSIDKLYYYLIPDDIADSVRPGHRVLVNFGKGKKERVGIVFDVCENIPEDVKKKKTKAILSALDKEPALSEEALSLASFMSERLFCTLFEASKVMFPAGSFLKILESYAAKDDHPDESLLSGDELAIFNYLREKGAFVESGSILRKFGLESDSPILRNLTEKKFLIKNTDTKRRVNDPTVKLVSLSPSFLQDGASFKITKKQEAVINLLSEIGSAVSKEISYFTGVSQSVIETLFRRGVVCYDDVPTPKIREKTKEEKDKSPIVLNEEQEKAYKELKNMAYSGRPSASLLFGVTGSGKTKVYMKLIDDLSKDGKGVIVLVPEISLTPQILDIFCKRYGEKVAVLHSGLSIGERYDEWNRVKNGEASIVIGTRSASFAPVKNLSLMVIDEEQESAYKSEMNPKYDARDIARFRCSYNNALLILSSATPSVETFAGAQNGRYRLIELKERYSKSGLPEVLTVDVSQNKNMGGFTTISNLLKDEIEKNLELKQQTILLLNRRGYNTFIACSKCKTVVTCPNCSISLTYHIANNRMMCHYCGYSEPVKTVCPQCGNETIRFSGYGTEKTEKELINIFPNAKILRMDSDTTYKKNSYGEKLKRFSQGEYDIMLGTQMVAKGLDFPNVTLAGVISVDSMLWNDDYKSSERTFDLLTQVLGRSGRGGKTGRAVIQTLSPENTVITLAANQDYRRFYDSEIKIRKGMIYPPYCDLCVISFAGIGEIQVKNAATAFFNIIKRKLKNDYKDEKVIILGPAPPKIAKLNGKDRERIIVKCKNSKTFRKMVSESLKEFSTMNVYNKISVGADINPENIF